MGWHPPTAASRSRLFLYGLLASICLLLAWRYMATLIPPRSAPSPAPKREGASLVRELEEQDAFVHGGGQATVEYTDDTRLRAKRDMTPLSRRLRKKRALDSPPPPPSSMAITAALPSTESLSRSFVSTYDDLFNSLTATSETLVADALTPALRKRVVGVPGTGISSEKEASALQAYLDCVSSTGEWVYESTGTSLARTGSSLTVHKQEGRYAACDKRFYKGKEGVAEPGGTEGDWEVRESLKWRWRVSPTCSALAPASLARTAASRSKRSLLPSRYRFCELLEGKHLLLVGDSTQWSLHDLLLDWTTLKPQTCYGDRYCMAHALCSEILHAGRKTSKQARMRARQEVESWSADQRVYHRLPVPPLASVASLEERQVGVDVPLQRPGTDLDDSDHPASDAVPHRHDQRALADSSRLVSTTILRYRRADGLRFARPQVIPDYRPESTGVRELNQQWLADSRRSDVVILTKAPLPLPQKGHNATFDAWLRDYVAEGQEEGAIGGGIKVEQKALRVLEAAKWTTEQVWLPELIETLRAIRAPPSPPDQLVVYRGGWRQHADCAVSSTRLQDGGVDAGRTLPLTSPGDGPPPHLAQPSLASLLMRRRRYPSATSARATELELVPLHIAYHNAQLLLQNHLARTVLLPAFGIPFLDLETPLSVWRAGMVGSSSAAPVQYPPGKGDKQQQTVLQPASGGGSKGLRSPTSGDCTRYCYPSPGLAVERFFLGAMATVFEAGWAGDADRKEEWMGAGFRHLQSRHAAGE
ncbi:hypothetical protein JCM10908_006837 [Rhodotorula pacifica]|uniref:uncharacterized protein n=1 Tax=Rhodotorula pacifica TaxID=1495444 RepID=UPI00317530E1